MLGARVPIWDSRRGVWRVRLLGPRTRSSVLIAPVAARFRFRAVGADHHGNAIELSAVACAGERLQCNWPPYHSPGSSVLSFITACSSMARFCCLRSIVAQIIASFCAAALD